MRSPAFRANNMIDQRQPRPALRALTAALAGAAVLVLAARPAVAQQVLPTGMTVVSGQAQVHTSGSQMTVVNSPQAILNWNSFSIGSGQSVYFQQAGSSSQVLNRVVGNDPSAIFGSLGSNGRVWLLNPNGVLFGQGARVDVAGLVTSTLRLDDNDWLAGRWRFGGADGAREVVNQGQLRTSFGGTIALIAPQVRNEGLVQADGGQVVLAAGRSVELIDTGAPNLGVRITADAGQAHNLGRLQAAGGRIDIHAAAVNSQGIVSADALSTDAAGQVWIKATQAVDLGASSRTSADGAAGGQVHIESAGARTTLEGTVSAQGQAGAGGHVTLLGREVGLMGAATVNVSGATGGGQAVVGGGEQGRDARYANARSVFFGPDARIAADAGQAGDGGRIVLWSDEATRAFGTLSARGGASAGNGGFIETSGGWLDARPRHVDVRAPRGQAGLWLLDPYDVLISDSAPDQNFNASFTATGEPTTISSATIVAALEAGTNVNITTGSGGSQPGDITVSSADLLTNSGGSTGHLTLTAGRHIDVIDSSIGGGYYGSMNVTLTAGAGGTITLDNSLIETAGLIRLEADGITLLPGTNVVAWGGGSNVDVIALYGRNYTPLSSFSNQAGSGALFAGGGGRWIVYGDNINSTNFDDGGLSYTFKRHGAAFGDWAQDGNGGGLVFSAAQTAVVTGTVLSRAYDGTLSANLSGYTVTPGVSGDTTSLDPYATAIYADKNAGTNKPATLSPEAVSFYDSNDMPVYGYTLVSNLSGTVTPAPLTGSLSALDKVYNGTTTATIEVSSLSGLIGSEQVQVQGTGRFNNKNVGNNKPVTPLNFSIFDGANGGLAINYTFVEPEGGPLTASITPRPLSFADLVVADKVYDGTTLATFASQPVFDTIAGDSVSIDGTLSARFADKNVGTAKPVQLLGTISLSGPDAANYQLQAQPTGLTASITPRPLELSGLAVADKVYDGTTQATVSGSAAVSALAGDTVLLGGMATARFVDKNAGVDKPVLVEGLTLRGPDAGNYMLAGTSATLVADITPLAVTVQGLTAADKVYDGTTVATLTGQARINALGNDSVTVSGAVQGSFADKNVGNDKPVTIGSFTLAGPDAGNYTLIAPGNLSASITPLGISLTGLGVADKVYDGTTAATLTGTARIDALGSDVVTVGGSGLAAFADKNAGQAKPVTFSGFVLGGPDAANYLLQPGTLAGNITPRPVDLGGLAAADKVYDGTTAVTLTGTLNATALPGDQISVAGSPVASFADKNAGQNKVVLVTGLSLSGPDAANYTVQSLGLTADITPRDLTVTGLSAASKVYDATTTATLTGSASLGAALPGDSVFLQGAISGSFVDKNVGQDKAVVISGFALGGSDAVNYRLVATGDLRASITPLTLQVNGLQALDKVYDGGTTAQLAGQASVAALPGDSVAVGGTVQANFADRHVGNNKPVTVSGQVLTGADAGNYTLLPTSGLAASITPAQLLYVATPTVRTTGQSLDGLPGTVSGFLGPDTLANATTGTAVFRTDATPGSPPGQYAVLGSGLAAADYVFAQAPGNARALQIMLDLTPTTTTLAGADQRVQTPTSVTLAKVSTSIGPSEVGMVDLSVEAGTTAPKVAPAVQPGKPDFGPVRLSVMSTDQVQGMLDGRALYMRNLLADSVTQLERNPGLADLRECQSLREAEEGQCLISARLKAQMAASGVALAPDIRPLPAMPATTPAPAAPAAPAPATPPPAPAAATAAAPEPAAGAVAVARPAPSARLPEVPSVRRRVVSASLPQIERKIALVVGIDNYADSSIPALSNAVRDARAIAQVFETKLGYETVVIENATRPALVAALNRLALTVGPRDSVVVYYAGHGELVESTKLGYWLLSDSRAKQPESWLSNSDISRLVAQIGASQVALISDSCYSGSLVTEERIRPAPTAPNPQSILERKTVVVMSSGGKEPVFDEGRNGHSPFAYHLMSTLDPLASWQAGGNVFERVRFAVARTLPQRPQYSAARSAGHQEGGDYLFEQRRLESAP